MNEINSLVDSSFAEVQDDTSTKAVLTTSSNEYAVVTFVNGASTVSHASVKSGTFPEGKKRVHHQSRM